MENEKAVEFYKKHLQRLKAYNDSHKELIRKSALESYQKIKSNPELYQKYLEKKRQKYHTKKQQQEQQNLDI
jgi:hypothetical protein